MTNIQLIRRALRRDAKAHYGSTRSHELTRFEDLVRHVEETRERLHDSYHEGSLSSCTHESCSETLYLLTS